MDQNVLSVVQPTQKIPLHIGFIVDGNRRWARARGLEPYEGHLASREYFYDVMLAAFDHGVKYVSAYLFSTENWKRSEKEVSALMELFMQMVVDDIQKLVNNSIRLRIIGLRTGLSEEMITAIHRAEAKTAKGNAGQLIICWNYGGQQEIADAVASIIENDIPAEDITPQVIADHLYATDVPPCDVIVRTSGEQRLSNFMLWRSAYSEFIFVEKNWPEMRPKDITAILKEYNSRERRHGG